MKRDLKRGTCFHYLSTDCGWSKCTAIMIHISSNKCTLWYCTPSWHISTRTYWCWNMCELICVINCVLQIAFCIWYIDYKNKQGMKNIKHWNYGSLSSNILRIKSNMAGGSVQKYTGKTAFSAVTNDLARTVLNSSNFSFFYDAYHKCVWNASSELEIS